MPECLIEASYSTEGVRGVADKRGTVRREAVDQLIAASGGKLESFYFAFGDADVYAIVEYPNNEVAATLALSINRTGAVQARTVVLLTPEEVDAAAEMAPEYRPPGT
jgi:uncharacterized protein with GYD domain